MCTLAVIRPTYYLRCRTKIIGLAVCGIPVWPTRQTSKTPSLFRTFLETHWKSGIPLIFGHSFRFRTSKRVETCDALTDYHWQTKNEKTKSKKKPLGHNLLRSRTKPFFNCFLAVFVVVVCFFIQRSTHLDSKQADWTEVANTTSRRSVIIIIIIIPQWTKDT